MSRKATGTIERSKDRTKLHVRVSITDDKGITHRPRLPMKPTLSDAAALRIAQAYVEDRSGKPYEETAVRQVKVARRLNQDELTVDAYVETLWLPSREGAVKSIRMDRTRYRKHLSPLIGHLPMTHVTTDRLRDVVEALDRKAEQGGTGRESFGRKSAVNVWAVASKLFSDAVESKRKELRVLKVNPALSVKPPEPPGELEMQWLFPSELQRLLACAAVAVERRRLYFGAVGCFARPGETLGLLWGRSIDVTHGMVRINRSYDHVSGEFHEYTKTGDSRHFAMEPTLRRMFEAMWNEQGRRPGLVFPTLGHLAEVLRADLMTAGVSRASLHVKRRGAVRIRFHDLRATGITYLALRGASDNEIRQRAGHTDFKTTLQYIRRGQLAAGASIGTPFQEPPAELTTQSSRILPSPAEPKRLSDGNPEEIRRAGEGIRILPVLPDGPHEAAFDAEPLAPGELSAPPDSVLGKSWANGSGGVDPAKIRYERLHRLSEVDPESAALGLAICRGLAAQQRIQAGDQSAAADYLAALLEGTALIGGRS